MKLPRHPSGHVPASILRFVAVCSCGVFARVSAADFAPNPDGRVTALALQSDGRLIVGGEFTRIDGQARARIARLQPGGALDPAFDPGAALSGAEITQLAVQPDGKILVRLRTGLLRLNADGSRDVGFAPHLEVIWETCMMALQADGKILLSGTNSVDPYFSVNLRLNADGSQEADFSRILGRPFSAAVRPDGKILFGGSEMAFLPDDRRDRREGLARLQPTGVLDPTLDAALNGLIDSLALLEDGQILIAGGFTSVRGQPRDHVARLDPDGAPDPGFVPAAMTFLEGAQRQGFFSKVVPLPGGGLALSGAFTSIGGKPRAGFARLMPNGSLDESSQPPLVGSVADMVVRPNGNIVLGGNFTLGPAPGLMNLAEIERIGAPAILSAPESRTAVAGTSVTLATAASGGDLHYQWRLDGAAIPGATAATLVIPSVQQFHAGSYTIDVSNSAGAVTSRATILTVARASLSSARLLNVSNRGYCAAEDRILVTGFTVSGEGSKTLLIRAIGPTLSTAFGVPDALADPQLAIFQSRPNGGNTLLFSNDDWGANADAVTTAAVTAEVGAFALARGAKDAALVVTLPPGAYTVVASGAAGASGTVLVEVYDAR